MKKHILLLFLFLGIQIAHGQYWEQMSAFPGTLRHSCGSFSLNGKGYIAGGYGDNNQVLNDLWEYDPTTDTYLQKNNLPIQVYGASYFVINNVAYLINGWTNTSGVTNDTLYSYDSQNDNWVAVTTYPGTPAYTCASFVLNNKVYIGIGYAPYTNELWEYDPAINTWTPKANYPGADRQNSTAFVINNIAYVGFGADGFGAFDDFYSYDPATDQWTLVTTFPGTERYAANCFVINDKAYISCGSDLNNFLTDCWEFDPSTVTWTQLPDFGGAPTHACTYFTINGIGYAGLGRSAVFNSGMWKFIPAGLNEIRGFAFRDHNANGSFDGTDSPESQLMVQVSPGGKIYSTNSAGLFKLPADTQITYTLNVLNVPSNYSLSGTLTPITFTTSGNIDSSSQIILTPSSVVADASIHLSSITPIRAGFEGFYTITCKNEGTVLLDSLEITLHLDTGIAYQSTTPASTPTFVSATYDTIRWSLYNLQPGATNSFLIRYYFLGFTGNLGDSVFANASVNSWVTEIDTTNNYSTYVDTVVGSFDPNDISVSSEILTPAEVASGKWLTYKIRFQNTGTYQANYVRVFDSIPGELDLSTFQLLAYSHQPCTYTIDGSNVIKFDFPGIILPDSNQNEPESHGFIEYRIKPRTNLVLGDVITNRADIYFDFNPPVITNDAVTIVDNTSSIVEVTTGNNDIRVYPNPSDDFIRVQLPEDQYLVNTVAVIIYDITGKKTILGSDMNSEVINVKSLTSGYYRIQLVQKDGKVFNGSFVRR